MWRERREQPLPGSLVWLMYSRALCLCPQTPHLQRLETTHKFISHHRPFTAQSETPGKGSGTILKFSAQSSMASVTDMDAFQPQAGWKQMTASSLETWFSGLYSEGGALSYDETLHRHSALLKMTYD